MGLHFSFEELNSKLDVLLGTRLLKEMWVKKKVRGIFFLGPTDHDFFPLKSDLILLGRNGHLQFIGQFIMINSTLTHKKFFVSNGHHAQEGSDLILGKLFS